MHVSIIIATASQNLCALRIFKPFILKKNYVWVYSATICSHLKYCSPLFIGMSISKQLTLKYVQLCSHHIICGTSFNCSLFPSLLIPILTICTNFIGLEFWVCKYWCSHMNIGAPLTCANIDTPAQTLMRLC